MGISMCCSPLAIRFFIHLRCSQIYFSHRREIYLLSSSQVIIRDQLIKLPTSHTYQISNTTDNEMCLFSSGKKHHRKHYVEEVYVAPRPVSRHSHHHHSHSPRASYSSVTRTTARPVSRGAVYVEQPRMSQSSYRRSGPVVVEQRRSTRSYR